MQHLLTRRYTWESAHYLPLVREGHKCKRMHGHHYACEITIAGELDDRGWLIDFWELDAIVMPKVVERVDHRLLNEIEGLDNPTAEVIARWVHTQIADALPLEVYVTEVKVFETPDAIAIYRSE